MNRTARCAGSPQSSRDKPEAMSWLANQTPAAGRKGGTFAAASTPGGARAGEYLRVLSMYREPPAGEVVLEDFERFAIARLRGADFACYRQLSAPIGGALCVHPPPPSPRALIRLPGTPLSREFQAP